MRIETPNIWKESQMSDSLSPATETTKLMSKERDPVQLNQTEMPMVCRAARKAKDLKKGKGTERKWNYIHGLSGLTHIGGKS